MDRSRAITLGLGGWLIVMGLMSPLFAEAWADNGVEEFFWSVCSFFVFVIVGVVVLLVGLARGGGRGMQQQQQIVVLAGGYAPPAAVAAPQAAQTRLRCPACKTLNAATARFCKQCGARFGSVAP